MFLLLVLTMIVLAGLLVADVQALATKPLTFTRGLYLGFLFSFLLLLTFAAVLLVMAVVE